MKVTSFQSDGQTTSASTIVEFRALAHRRTTPSVAQDGDDLAVEGVEILRIVGPRVDYSVRVAKLGTSALDLNDYRWVVQSWFSEDAFLNKAVDTLAAGEELQGPRLFEPGQKYNRVATAENLGAFVRPPFLIVRCIHLGWSPRSTTGTTC